MSSSSDFFDSISLPLNTEDPEFEFVNAVTVSDKFAEATVMNGVLSREIEQAAQALAEAEHSYDIAKRNLAKLRRRIVADNYGKLTKSADRETQEAFVLAHAYDKTELLSELEEEEELYFREKGRLKMQYDKLKARLWAFERTMTYLTEWLNNDKFRTRMHEEGVRGR
jgi:hypothetical protein